MRVHHVLAGRPFEDGEAPILRGNQRGAALLAIALIVDELRGREMPRAAELVGMTKDRPRRLRSARSR